MRFLLLGLWLTTTALADDTLALQQRINHCRPNGVVQLEQRTYLIGPVLLKSHCSYTGVPGKTVLQLQASNQFIFEASEQKDIRISGITFDGNDRGGAIVLRGNGPASEITVENCSFTHVPGSAPFPANLSVFSSWALVDGVFRENTFTDVAGGIWLTAVERVTIENNSFTNITQGDGIFIAPNPVPFPSGRNIRITGNKGTHFARIALELFRPDPPNGSSLIAPVIENNTFSDWISPRDGFGLSITHGDGAIVRNNVIRNPNRPQQYVGIEIIVRDAVVEGNTVDSGFAYGIAVQGTPGSRLLRNRLENAFEAGIILACDAGRNRCNSRGSLISDNVITNARKIGIQLDNDWSDSKLTGNTITRTGGYWPDDNKILFEGIHQSPAPGPGFIQSNTIVQNGAVPPAGFNFCGVKINSPMSGSVISDNLVRSESRIPLGVGILSNTGGALTAWSIERDRFENLKQNQI